MNRLPTAEAILREFEPDFTPSPFRMGQIDPSYTSGGPKIIFDGETAVSTKQYPYLSTYSPVASDRVLLAKVGGTYVVLAKII